VLRPWPSHGGCWTIKRGDSGLDPDDTTRLHVDSPIRSRLHKGSFPPLENWSSSSTFPPKRSPCFKTLPTLVDIHWLKYLLSHSSCRRPRPPAPPPPPRSPHSLSKPWPIKSRIMWHISARLQPGESMWFFFTNQGVGLQFFLDQLQFTINIYRAQFATGLTTKHVIKLSPSHSIRQQAMAMLLGKIVRLQCIITQLFQPLTSERNIMPPSTLVALVIHLPPCHPRLWIPPFLATIDMETHSRTRTQSLRIAKYFLSLLMATYFPARKFLNRRYLRFPTSAGRNTMGTLTRCSFKPNIQLQMDPGTPRNCPRQWIQSAWVSSLQCRLPSTILYKTAGLSTAPKSSRQRWTIPKCLPSLSHLHWDTLFRCIHHLAHAFIVPGRFAWNHSLARATSSAIDNRFIWESSIIASGLDATIIMGRGMFAATSWGLIKRRGMALLEFLSDVLIWDGK
jgi:hypothetical protein